MTRLRSHMWPCAGLFVLVGCGARVLEPEPEGEAGTGGRGGADGGEAGSSGAGDAGNGGDPDASVGGSGPIGGTGSVLGGTGGEVGGTGGVAGDCATSDPAATCSQLSEGWFAVKIALDVWWPGEPVRDPGRGELALTLLARVGDVCSGDSDQTAELKLCDVSLPIATSDVGCEAYELSFDEALWDSARMPRFVTPMERALLLPGEMISLAPWIGLVGIDLFDPADLPTVEQRDSFECASGVGEECFSDHDQDERPGVTMIPRNDKATYVGSLDDGLCTNGAGYRFLATPVTIDITAGGANNPFRASELHVGMRSHAGVAAEIARDCGSAVGSSSGDGFALRASGCMVDPTSLHETDPRRTGDLRCNEDEMFILDMMLPAYRVLQPRETPTDTQPPLGWAMKGRDISKAPSLGPRSALVHLAGLGEAEPSCATVRATAFPDL